MVAGMRTGMTFNHHRVMRRRDEHSVPNLSFFVEGLGWC